jgi:hypothetical protein
MNGFRIFTRWLIVAVVLIGSVVFVIRNYSWVFAKKVKGRVLNVERVTDPASILGSRPTEAQLHSYAILIQGHDGRLYAASSDDRQWQVVKKGYCVEALLYRYPPWNLDKANTYFNARIDQLSLCPGETELPDQPAIPPPEKPERRADPLAKPPAADSASPGPSQGH